MKIHVKVGDLIEHFTQAAITIDRKSADQPASKVYLRAKSRKDADGDKHFMYLYSTNQASRTFIKVPVEDISEEGETLIDPDKLLGGLQGRSPELIADISTESEKARTRVKVGKNVFHLPYLDAVEKITKEVKDLPVAPVLTQITAQALLEFIRRNTFCIPSGSNGQQRFAMDVLAVRGGGGGFTASATDGHVIGLNTFKSTEIVDLKTILIPQEALLPLQKLLQKHKEATVSIIEGGRTPHGDLQEVFFQMSGVLFGSRLNNGKFPNVELVLKQHEFAFQAGVDREALRSALLRAANFVENAVDKRYLTLSLLTPTELRIKASNTVSDLDDEVEVTEVKGEFSPVTVVINIDYLSSIAACIQSEVLFIGFNPDKTKAVVVHDESESISTQYAVMPIHKQAAKPAAAKAV